MPSQLELVWHRVSHWLSFPFKLTSTVLQSPREVTKWWIGSVWRPMAYICLPRLPVRSGRPMEWTISKLHSCKGSSTSHWDGSGYSNRYRLINIYLLHQVWWRKSQELHDQATRAFMVWRRLLPLQLRMWLHRYATDFYLRTLLSGNDTPLY